MTGKAISIIIPAVMFVFSALNVDAQEKFRYEWSYVKTDGNLGNMSPDRKVKAIIDRHKPVMDARMNEVIGYSDVDLLREGCDSPMMNFVVDALREMGEKYTGDDVDIAIINLGGIRTDLNKGVIRVYDIYTVSPFDNKLMVLDIEGKYLKKLFEDVVARKNGFEAVSNVSLLIKDRKILDFKIDGKSVEDSKTYKVATLDFLLGGGDKMKYLHKYTKLTDTGAFVRDVLIEYVKGLSAEGKHIEAAADGRVRVIE